ncbi:hypothetical protein NG895_11970 [Aeoliella sp. ICT_H6.2]|uniref:Secreted protein n=1 Tax=Aeoliella straminimaris TaxID=2954799 RepID=A0A9X2F967_9BACT|nr:hypothetical protein [Aeoliella straminimaris]MCO6044625.1 hypothetical protein [Aeoliella straminimaris]
MQAIITGTSVTRRLATLLPAGLLITAVVASPAAAFWGDQGNQCCTDACVRREPVKGAAHDIYNYLENGRAANAMWPYPYVCPDRVWAHAPFDIMVANGWRRQNLLGAHHFDPQTGKLTRAGELKVEWILTQTPPSRRQVFVERSMNDDVTQNRIAQAQQFANGLPIEGGDTIVQDTYVRSPSRAAGMVDGERNSFIENRKPAVLPAGTTSTSSAASN